VRKELIVSNMLLTTPKFQGILYIENIIYVESGTFFTTMTRKYAYHAYV